MGEPTAREVAAELRSVALLIRLMGLDGLSKAIDEGRVTFAAPLSQPQHEGKA